MTGARGLASATANGGLIPRQEAPATAEGFGTIARSSRAQVTGLAGWNTSSSHLY
jgi:hypothetical protein